MQTCQIYKTEKKKIEFDIHKAANSTFTQKILKGTTSIVAV